MALQYQQLTVTSAARAPLPYNQPLTRQTVRRASETDGSTREKERRRSANYMPNIWDYNSISTAFLASSDDYTEAKYGEEIERMKIYVKGLIGEMMDDPLEKLELIDVVQRLGMQYHFDAEIKLVLRIIYDQLNIINNNIFDDLYATALLFRLLRQHGYIVHQDVFKKFMDSGGYFRESLSEDVKGMLSLYEASFHGRTDEVIIDEAMAFSTASLRNKTSLGVEKTRLAQMVDHALDMPIHWRPNRLEARWFIDVYSDEPCMDVTLLRLAKLDYNIVQSSHQKNIAELIRWWVGLGLSKITFVRDRLVEHYLWGVMMVFEPQYKAHLRAIATIGSMITIIDDCYDIYGTLDELEILTELVNRWDITEVDRLPHAIRVCFVALFNTTNEIGLELMVEHGYNFIPYLHNMWKGQCNAYMEEARWYHNGIKPTFKEYLTNGVCTIGALIGLFCTFLTTTTAADINQETLDFISEIPTIMRSSAEILRLNNDLATSSYELARGDNLKAVECYMAETGCSEEAARLHIRNLVRDTWKTMNEAAVIKYPFKGRPFVEACMNLARGSQCFYQYGDGHGLPDNETKLHIMSTLVEPVPMDL